MLARVAAAAVLVAVASRYPAGACVLTVRGEKVPVASCLKEEQSESVEILAFSAQCSYFGAVTGYPPTAPACA